MIFILLVSIFGVITMKAQDVAEKEYIILNQPKYNQEKFKEVSQNEWKKEIENSKGAYEVIANSNDTIVLDSLDIGDIHINIPRFFLIHPKDGDYTILFNLIDVIFDEDSQTAFFDLNDQTNAFIFSISNRNNLSKNNNSNIQIAGHSQNILQKFNYKLFKDYLEQNLDVLVFTISQLNSKNNLELWGIKDNRLIILSFEKNEIKELDGEKFYQENYAIKGVKNIQAICI